MKNLLILLFLIPLTLSSQSNDYLPKGIEKARSKDLIKQFENLKLLSTSDDDFSAASANTEELNLLLAK